MKYFKRRFEETRGDEHDDWGRATFYFETDDSMWPQRQLEIYDNGRVLAYHADHEEDEFGFLADETLNKKDFASYAITAAEFEAAWQTHVRNA